MDWRKLADKQEMMIEKAETVEMIDIEIHNIVHEVLEDYLKGKKTAEQTVKIIDDKVSIYLKE
ncbi:MAG: hypothetical protein ACYDG2_13725 [Ruminiclostridium sp.]